MNIPLRQYWELLVQYLRPQWPRATALAVLLFAGIGMQVANPQIIRYVIDGARSGVESGALVAASVLFIAIAVVQQAVAVLATYVSENVGWTATNALRADLAAHCLGLDMSFHNARTPGEMIERIDGDVTALSTFFSQFVIQIAGNGLLLVGVLALLYREDWRVGLALTGFVLLAVWALNHFRSLAVPHWTAERQASAELFGFLEERLAGTEDIRASGARAYVLRQFYKLLRAQMQKLLKAALMINVLLNTTFVLFALGTAVAFIVGGLLYRQGALTLGAAYLVFYYTSLIEHPIVRISRQMSELQKAGAGIVRVRELLALQPTVADPTPGVPLPEGALGVEFDNVSFGYDGGAETEKVIDGVTFRLAPGRVLGLLGRTGSGKTTLTRLLFRLYDPGTGAIRLGGATARVDVRDVSLPELRQRVGMVTQNIQLFNATVRDNLTFFDPQADDERIVQVIAGLGLGDWLAGLPSGLDTVLESGGGGLSAGQAQLLAFARIFLHDPGLVVLDEASSRLDPATEHLVEQAVDRLVYAGGRTAIIIAHRLATVQRADEILILDDGRIVEHGDRAALARDPASRFYRLLQTGLEEVLA